MDSNIISALVGTAVGFGLSECSTLIRAWRLNRQQAQSVRILLSIEIDQNLSLLNEFWAKIKNLNDECVHNKPELCVRMIGLPLPKFSEKVLNSQLPQLTSALNPNQIEQVSQHYNSLGGISNIYAKLNELYRDTADLSNPISIPPVTTDHDLKRNFRRQVALMSTTFGMNACLYWDEAQTLFTSTVTIGNPLQSKSKK